MRPESGVYLRKVMAAYNTGLSTIYDKKKEGTFMISNGIK